MQWAIKGQSLGWGVGVANLRKSWTDFSLSLQAKAVTLAGPVLSLG